MVFGLLFPPAAGLPKESPSPNIRGSHRLLHHSRGTHSPSEFYFFGPSIFTVFQQAIAFNVYCTGLRCPGVPNVDRSPRLCPSFAFSLLFFKLAFRSQVMDPDSTPDFGGFVFTLLGPPRGPSFWLPPGSCWKIPCIR